MILMQFVQNFLNNTMNDNNYTKIILPLVQQIMLKEFKKIYGNIVSNITNYNQLRKEAYEILLLYDILHNQEIQKNKQQTPNNLQNIQEQLIQNPQNDLVLKKTNSETQESPVRNFTNNTKDICSFQNNSLGKKAILRKDENNWPNKTLPDIYVCDFENCKKKYKAKENLIMHIKNKHFCERPCICNVCRKSYSHRSGKYKELFSQFYFI